jgi:murein DD-endopeptidase MepM/ murein hydrolase activator NlpD
MGEQALAPRRLLRIVCAVAGVGLLAACAIEPQTAAPVFLRGAGPEGGEGAVAAPLAPPQARRIVVRPGQSLGRIAQDYRVSKGAIIAANHLKPPYKLEAGQRLVIPGAAPPPAHLAIVSAPLPPPPAPAAAAAGRPPPEIIPLDGPMPAKPAAAPPQGASGSAAPPQGASGSARAPNTASAGPAAAGDARTEAAAAGARLPRGALLPWPVRGRVLAGYGTAQGGGHNDGINIAAPRGTPVRAVDAGVVAYSGNELRGYGNLVLVKHRSGLISAYAHCEELLVKRGDKVGRGQVIAKVGATGGVAEPQLHFELRRGQRAVDPREFLTPAPSAGTAENARQG